MLFNRRRRIYFLLGLHTSEVSDLYWGVADALGEAAALNLATIPNTNCQHSDPMPRSLDCGSSRPRLHIAHGPIEKFIESLIFSYAYAEEHGGGLTVEDVESALKELRENMSEAISEARLITSRYPHGSK